MSLLQKALLTGSRFSRFETVSSFLKVHLKLSVLDHISDAETYRANLFLCSCAKGVAGGTAEMAAFNS